MRESGDKPWDFAETKPLNLRATPVFWTPSGIFLAGQVWYWMNHSYFYIFLYISENHISIHWRAFFLNPSQSLDVHISLMDEWVPNVHDKRNMSFHCLSFVIPLQVWTLTNQGKIPMVGHSTLKSWKLDPAVVPRILRTSQCTNCVGANFHSNLGGQPPEWPIDSIDSIHPKFTIAIQTHRKKKKN